LLPYYGVLVQIARLITLSTALSLVHRNSFPNFHILLNFANFRGGPLSKRMQIPKKESKPSEIACKQSAHVRTISKIEKRRELVRALCNEQCQKNSFKRLYIVKGLLVFGRKSFLFERISMRILMRWRGLGSSSPYSKDHTYVCHDSLICVP